MARVPTLDDVAQVGLASQTGAPTGTPDSFGASPARALGRAAQVGGAIVSSFKTARANRQLATAVTTSSNELKQAQFDFESDPDIDTVEERFSARSEEIRKAALENITEKAARDAFQTEFARSSGTIGVSVQRTARARFVDQSQAALFEDTNSFAALVARADSDNERDDFFAKGLAGIDDAVDTGIIKAEAGAKEKQRFRAKISANDARLLLLEDPEQAVVELADPTGLFPDLDETTRLSLLDRAQRRADSQRSSRLREQEKADKAQDDALDERQDQAEIDMIPEVLAGNVSDERLLDALETRTVSREAFARLRQLNRADADVEDDTQVFLQLQQDALDADPSIPGRIASAVENRLLTREGAAGLLSRFDSARQRGGILARADVKAGFQFVDQTVGGVRGPLAILDSASSARVVRAKQEYTNRILEAAKSPELLNSQLIAEEVTKQFRLTPPSPSEFARPRFLVGTRAKPDLDATRVKTLDALDAGTITRTEALRELKNLDAIEDAIK